VRALKIAACDRDCKIRLFIGDVAGHHSVEANMGFGSIEVSARKLHSVLLNEFRVGRVDWVKIDVEGAELCKRYRMKSFFKQLCIIRWFWSCTKRRFHSNCHEYHRKE
jgi:hypothetical protein